MPKPMLKQPQEIIQSASLLSATPQSSQKQQATKMDKMKLDRLLRRPR